METRKRFILFFGPHRFLRPYCVCDSNEFAFLFLYFLHFFFHPQPFQFPFLNFFKFNRVENKSLNIIKGEVLFSNLFFRRKKGDAQNVNISSDIEFSLRIAWDKRILHLHAVYTFDYLKINKSHEILELLISEAFRYIV